MFLNFPLNNSFLFRHDQVVFFRLNLTYHLLAFFVLVRIVENLVENETQYTSSSLY